MSFIDVEVTSDEATLADRGIDRLQTSWPDWEPNEADPEVMILEVCASMTADAARTCGFVPSGVWRAFGEKLHGIPFSEGAHAVADLIFTLTDTNGQIIPAGAEVEIDNHVFATDQDVEAAAGVASVEAAATATEPGVEFNALVGDRVEPISALARVASVALVAPTADGLDPETPEEYQNRLSIELQLRGRTLVTLRDHELLAQTNPAVFRVVAEHLGARAIRVTGIDKAGTTLSATVKDELVDAYAALRLVNVTMTMADPSFKAVDVTYTVKAFPDQDPVALEADIDALLGDRLSPLVWGASPDSHGDPSPNRWYNEPRVRKNKIIDIIGGHPGVDYVDTLTLAAAGVVAEANGDLILPGNVPLPTPGVMTGTIT